MRRVQLVRLRFRTAVRRGLWGRVAGGTRCRSRPCLWSLLSVLMVPCRRSLNRRIQPVRVRTRRRVFDQRVPTLKGALGLRQSRHPLREAAHGPATVVLSQSQGSRWCGKRGNCLSLESNRGAGACTPEPKTHDFASNHRRAVRLFGSVGCPAAACFSLCPGQMGDMPSGQHAQGAPPFIGVAGGRADARGDRVSDPHRGRRGQKDGRHRDKLHRGWHRLHEGTQGAVDGGLPVGGAGQAGTSNSLLNQKQTRGSLPPNGGRLDKGVHKLSRAEGWSYA